MKTRLSPAAAQDLSEILRRLRLDSRSAVIGFRDRFTRLRQFLGEHPYAGRKTDDPTVRYVNATPYPYLIFYEQIEGDLVIMRLIHGARNPRSMPASLASQPRR